MTDLDELPRFAATRQFVREATPIYAFLLSLCWVALLVMLAATMADAVRDGEPVFVGFLLYGAFVVLLTIPAGALWSDMREAAHEHYGLEKADDGG